MQHYFLTLLHWLRCSLKSDRSHSFFYCTFSIDQRPVWNLAASLLIAFPPLISFVTNVWLIVKSDCSMEGLIRWESKSICQVMFDRVIGGSFKKLRGLRWVTKELKPLCRKFGIASWRWAAVLVQRPPKVIHHEKISFCSLMWATCCVGSRSNDQNLARSDRGWSVLSHCFHQQLLSFIDLAGREWLVMFKMEACSTVSVPTLGKIKYSSLFPLPRTAIKHIPPSTRSWF